MCASFLFKKGVYYQNFGSVVKSKPIEPVLYSFVKRRVYIRKRKKEEEKRMKIEMGHKMEIKVFLFFLLFVVFFKSMRRFLLCAVVTFLDQT